MPYEGYGPGIVGTRYNAGAPVAGTNEVQTLTIGGTPTGGSFKLAYEGRRTASIPWNATNATLLASLQAQLDAITGANWIVATAGTLTAGIGTILLTFSGGDVAHRAVNTIVDRYERAHRHRADLGDCRNDTRRGCYGARRAAWDCSR
jgi:hypothetical protein